MLHTYNWLAASLIARNLGNTLSNEQQKNATAEFDFSRLYSKSRLLRAFEEAAPAGSCSGSCGCSERYNRQKEESAIKMNRSYWAQDKDLREDSYFAEENQYQLYRKCHRYHLWLYRQYTDSGNELQIECAGTRIYFRPSTRYQFHQ